VKVADEIVAESSRARFYRADLHVHSYNASHDVKDSGLIPTAIVATALSEGLGLVAITDHNEIGNVAELMSCAVGKPLLAIPGIELSTPEGHLLVYFETVAALSEYYGKLSFADRGKPESRCRTSMLECLNYIDHTKGFAILAHVDAQGGLEEKVPGYPPHKSDIICQRALLGIELQSALSQIFFAASDPEAQRVLIGQKRAQHLNLGQNQNLARVMFSDSHTLSALGRNAQGNRRVTRIKLDKPTFQGLRIALEDSDARIRLEDEIPGDVPYLMGLKLEGGLLNGQIVHFSRNLNCIIGGRGAGKSTLFEAVRSVSENQSPSKIVDSEIWPESLTSVWVDQSGQQHTVVRRIHEEPVNQDDPTLGLVTFPMDAYGQNETAQTSVKAQSDPHALLDYLDQFMLFKNLKTERENLRQGLLDNQTQIEKAQIEVAKIPDFTRLLVSVQQQLQAVEKAKATEIVTLERKVAEERTLRSEIERKIGELSGKAKQSAVLTVILDFRKLAPAAPLSVGPKEYGSIVQLFDQLEQSEKVSQASAIENIRRLAIDCRAPLEDWKAREQKTLEYIETKRKELAAQGVRLDIAFIRKLATDEADYKKSLTNLATWETHLKELKKARIELLKLLVQIKSRIYTIRSAYAVKASSSLKGSLGDLLISVKFVEGALSVAASDVLQRAMSWKTTRVPRGALIVEQATVPRLLDAIRKTDPTVLTQVIGPDGTNLFTHADALEIIKALSQQQFLFELERCENDDRPQIIVTKMLHEAGKPPRAVSRDFSRLSLGQQQSVLLSLMLLSDSPYPLIIDQPEDNLDSEFIYHSLVPVLRRAKERRQVIVVTHNANIAVLGDAELIIALKSTKD
jgi:ABC-type cobalamin/Fe3+-siderophores transport system ATPase subunit